MLEPMWLWGILGLVLVAAEMATGTFYILWFGVAALTVSGLLLFFPALHGDMQLLVFAALALGSLALWKFFYKKSATNDLRVGQSQGDEIGRIGTISAATNRHRNGRIQFVQGVMGSKDWSAASHDDLKVGDEAEITAIIGNTLQVQRHVPPH